MASLRSIMNDDDDSEPIVNKKPERPDPSGPPHFHNPFRSSVSSGQPSRHNSFSEANTATLPYPHHRDHSLSFAGPSSSAGLPHPSFLPSSTRPSLVHQNSTESMDHTMYGGHGQRLSPGFLTSGGRSMQSPDPADYGRQGHRTSPGAMPPMQRPLAGSSASAADPSPKLTPITGRVSRAKKGVPVHVCETCKPPKTFTRAEHLRRHQLSHQTPQYPCHWPGCDRAFHRQDLAQRHIQRHEQDERGARGHDDRSSPQDSFPDDGSYTSLSRVLSSDGSEAGMPAGQSTGLGRSYSGVQSHGASGHYGQGGGPASGSPGQGYDQAGHLPPGDYSGRSRQYGYTHTPITSPNVPSLYHSPASVRQSPLPSTGGFGEYRTPRSGALPAGYVPTPPGVLPSLTIPDDKAPGLVASGDASPWQSSASSSFSTPAVDWNVPSFSTRDIRSPVMGLGLEPMSYSGYSLNPYPVSPQQGVTPMMESPMVYQEEHSAILNMAHANQPYSPVRSIAPTTTTVPGSSAEHIVTAPVPIQAASLLGRRKGDAPLGLYSNAVFSTAFLLPQAVRNAVPGYLEIYWKWFDSLYPIVHRPSLHTGADELLRFAMAAVAAQLLPGEEDHDKAHTLHAFAWQEVKRISRWSVQNMQTILLCELYARFRGQKAVTSASNPFREMYSRDSLFSLVFSTPASQWHPYSTNSPPQVVKSHKVSANHCSGGPSDECWNLWIEAETRRRLLAACFALDVHSSMYYGRPLTRNFNTTKPPIPLTRATADAWAATTAQSWDSARRSIQGPLTLQDETCSAERVASAPTLDRAVLMASEALGLSKLPSSGEHEFTGEPDLSHTERLSLLFSGAPVANTYISLHFTPLHDLLTVSGNGCLLGHNVLDVGRLQVSARRCQAWSTSQDAGAAARYAAKALLAFFDDFRDTHGDSLRQDSEDDITTGRDWNMSDITDCWALYLCALICCAAGGDLARQATSTVGAPLPPLKNLTHSVAAVGASANNNNEAARKEEAGAKRWLGAMAIATPQQAMSLRNHGEAIGVARMVRRRLVLETAGNKSRLLADAVSNIGKLADGPIER